jgi:hypothetical protein
MSFDLERVVNMTRAVFLDKRCILHTEAIIYATPIYCGMQVVKAPRLGQVASRARILYRRRPRRLRTAEKVDVVEEMDIDVQVGSRVAGSWLGYPRAGS